MLARLMLWAATPASTGWLAFGLVAILAGGWVAWDHRGDKIADLEYQLLKCRGNPKQQQQIEKLAEKVQEQAQDKAQDAIRKIQELPNDCYDLDGPSPLDRVYDNPGKAGNP